MLTKDYIIEIKRTRKGFNYSWLREALLRNIYTKNMYAQLTNRLPNTILLVVHNFGTSLPEKYSHYLIEINEEDALRKGKDKVVFLSKDELETLNSEELQKRLGLYA
jgi:hypothetical protein